MWGVYVGRPKSTSNHHFRGGLSRKEVSGVVRNNRQKDWDSGSPIHCHSCVVNVTTKRNPSPDKETRIRR